VSLSVILLTFRAPGADPRPRARDRPRWRQGAQR